MRRDSYTISFTCPICGRFLLTSNSFTAPALNFFNKDTGIKLVEQLVERKGQRECTKCNQSFKITHFEYGTSL